MNIHSFSFNAFEERCHLICDASGKAAIVDPGFITNEEKQELYGYISSNGLSPVCVLLTHAHFDHIYGLGQLTEDFDIPVYMDGKDREMFVNNEKICPLFGMPVPAPVCAKHVVSVSEGDKINVGSLVFEVLSTPGHTPGGVCFLERKEKVLFSGDTLFAGSIGRTDSPWGDYDALMKGIFEQLMVLDGDTRVFPGHGPDTSIADERMKNPFLLPFNEPLPDDF